MAMRIAFIKALFSKAFEGLDYTLEFIDDVNITYSFYTSYSVTAYPLLANIHPCQGLFFLRAPLI